MEDNFKMDLQVVCLGGGVGVIGVARVGDRGRAVVNVVMNFWVP